MTNRVKITATKQSECFGSLEPGDLFVHITVPLQDCPTVYMRLVNGRNAVDLNNGTEVSFKNSHKVEQICPPQGVYIKGKGLNI